MAGQHKVPIPGISSRAKVVAYGPPLCWRMQDLFQINAAYHKARKAALRRKHVPDAVAFGGLTHSMRKRLRLRTYRPRPQFAPAPRPHIDRLS